MQTIPVRSTAFAYDVLIGPNLLAQTGPRAKAAARSPRATVITDANVGAHYLGPTMESLRGEGLAAEGVTVPAGEASKTLEQAGRLHDALLRFGMDRGSVVVGLGGGVVTDLAGFVAATYMRGTAWVAVSTSLLGQVDASVGGKTAVDHPACKNLIGVFHQPSAVLADVGALATLPDEELRTGLAEVVKHAMIRDAALLETLEARADAILARDAEVLEEIVAWNIRIKAEVVAQDERESGLRRILNYGHTIGHALESLSAESPEMSGGRALTHGRAVALGMMAESRIAEARGMVKRAVVARQRGMLERFGLPVGLDAAADSSRSLAILKHDKKAEAGRVRFVLPEDVGRVTVVDDVGDAEIRAAIESLSAG